MSIEEKIKHFAELAQPGAAGVEGRVVVGGERVVRIETGTGRLGAQQQQRQADGRGCARALQARAPVRRHR